MKASEVILAKRAIDEAERDVGDLKRGLLRRCGWHYSSNNPSCCWIWSKSFPESRQQWQWDKTGTNKVPSPAFTINGASTDLAIKIELNWQTLYRDDTEDDPDLEALLAGSHD